jgi:4-alpha-glucanotransferase
MRFVDWLASAGQRWWQMLPVGPVGYGNSPYSAQSAFAGNPMLIPLEPLAKRGLFRASDLEGAEELPRDRVDFDATERFRTRCLRLAFEHFRRADPAFAAFCEENRAWLDDYALFRALKKEHGGVEWTRWRPEYRDRKRAALAQATRDLAGDVAFAKLEQFWFHEAFREIKAHGNARGVGLIGDLPIFVAHDSADVWQHRELFRLDAGGMPTVVAGVPPDYFSRTGQRWGNPLYRWARMKRTGYAWWIDRMRAMLQRFDAIRLDHFIGFQRYWEIPAAEPTAENGRWIKGPGADFFVALEAALGHLPLIAEDLGVVTRSVTRLRDRFKLPGTKILQFAFGTDPAAQTFLPHAYARRAVVYTGTHDNDTTVGWFTDPGGDASTRSAEQAEKERRAVLRYLGLRDGAAIHWDMIRMVHLSVADTAIVPLQDVLGLGSEARMNRPGTAEGNWAFRFADLPPQAAEHLRDLTRTYGRAALEDKG